MTDVCFAGYIIPGYKPESLRRSEKQSEEAQALRPVRLPRTFCSCGKVEAFKVEHAIAKHLLKSALMISDDGQPEKLMSEVCCLKTTHRWPHTITFLTSDAVYQAEPTEELAEPEAEFEFARTESWKITAKLPISAVYYTRLMHIDFS